MTRKAENNTRGLKTERGVVLLIVLILSGIALAVMTALIYMITAGTQISGMEKRYKTAKDAAFGGWDIVSQVIALRGQTADTAAFQTTLNTFSMNADLDTTDTNCSATKDSVTYTNLAAKIMLPTANWTPQCSNVLTVGPSSNDIKMELGTTTKFTVYAKIVGTVEGNTGGDTGLLTKGVVASGSGDVAVAPMPYLYAVEIDAENASNPTERAKLSVLYQY